MKPSQIWDQIVEENPWLFPLVLASPLCRFCGFNQNIKTTVSGDVEIHTAHAADCPVIKDRSFPSTICVTPLTGKISKLSKPWSSIVTCDPAGPDDEVSEKPQTFQGGPHYFVDGVCGCGQRPSDEPKPCPYSPQRVS